MSFRRHCALLALAITGCASTSGGSSLADAGVLDAAAPIDDAGPGDAAMPITVRQLITFGSSSTAGTGASTESARYVNLLAAWLGAPLLNLGTSGQRIADVEAALPMALAALDGGSPSSSAIDLVTFLPLTDFANAAGDTIASGYDPVISQLERAGAWVVFGIPAIDAQYVCGRGPLRGPDGECYDAALADDYDAKGAAVRRMLEQHARTSAASIWQDYAEHPDWSRADGHPNDPGHLHIARSFEVEIARRLDVDAGLP